ncbi:hypothetical protein SNEBB_002279 [Seison nebaliae]|nr:hypothetical protein SNEBB_002279 [Seison nebaliae]
MDIIREDYYEDEQRYLEEHNEPNNIEQRKVYNCTTEEKFDYIVANLSRIEKNQENMMALFRNSRTITATRRNICCNYEDLLKLEEELQDVQVMQEKINQLSLIGGSNTRTILKEIFKKIKQIAKYFPIKRLQCFCSKSKEQFNKSIRLALCSR